MSHRHLTQLNKRIRKLEVKDMSRRKIKENGNDDRLFDFRKISQMKGAKKSRQENHTQHENTPE